MGHQNTFGRAEARSLSAFIAVMLALAMASPVSARDVRAGELSRQVLKLEAAGGRRSFLVHLPKSAPPAGQRPVVVVLHGAFSSGRGMVKVTGFNRLADREGFVVVYPQGIGLLGLFRHWNAGHCCAKAMRDGLDDVGLVAAVVDRVCRDLGGDPQRIYLVGNSNGGMLAYRVAAERPQLVAAAAVAGASIGGRPEPGDEVVHIDHPELPVPMLVLHGADDPQVPYGGGAAAGRKSGTVHLPVADSVAFWVRANRCSPSPVREFERDGAVVREVWSRDSTPTVVLLTLHGWGHDWPGVHFTRRLPESDPLRGFDAASVIWRFFEQHRRSPSSTAGCSGS